MPQENADVSILQAFVLNIKNFTSRSANCKLSSILHSDLYSHAVFSTMILKTRNTVIPWRLEVNLSPTLLYFCEVELI